MKFAALFGANASGKSNLVAAISFARRAIVSRLPEAHTTKYFKGIESNQQSKSYFEFEIKIEDKYFSYGFEILLSKSSFKSEWLMELLPNGKDREVFTRDIEKGIYTVNKYFLNTKLLNKLELYADDIRNDDSILFLKLMNQNKENFYKDHIEAEALQNVYSWILKRLDVNFADIPITNYSYFMSPNSDEINRVISAFGTGITNISFDSVAPESKLADLPKELVKEIQTKLEKNSAANKKTGKEHFQIMLRNSNKDFVIFEIDDKDNITAKTIRFNHGKNDIFFNLSEESDGTVRILDLLEILFNADSEKIYIIDEIDRCLHPQLTYKFVKTFLELAAERNIQLIVTTHESRLLDFDLLRRDEIWFVDKNNSGESHVYSLEEYNSRFDQKIDKAYLEGRYGGVPLFSTIFPNKEV